VNLSVLSLENNFRANEIKLAMRMTSAANRKAQQQQRLGQYANRFEEVPVTSAMTRVSSPVTLFLTASGR